MVIRITPFRLFVVAAIAATAVMLVSGPAKNLPEYQPTATTGSASTVAIYKADFVCHPCTGPAVHSASVVTTSDGKLRAVWFGGSREGAGDVRIFSSSRTAGMHGWSKETAILDRSQASLHLHRYIRKLGNPVLGRDKNGRLWLFFVSVSAGGWSGSAINYQISTDNGQTWSLPKRLVTSPWFNVSTLVRGNPVPYADGSIGLPVYHELVGKFSEMLHISAGGRVLAKTRISHGKQSFQPVVALVSKTRAVLAARSANPANRHIFVARTDDAGWSWSRPVATSLPNPDAGLAIVTGPENSLLVVYNDSETDRGNLALAISHDLGRTWKRVHYFERRTRPGSGEEYSYPAIIRNGDRYHLVYTWRRKGIRYVTFNDAWLRQQEHRQ